MPVPRRRSKLVAALGAVLVGLLIVAGCGGAEPDRESGTLRVVVSTTVIADWVTQVGGDAVQLTTLVPPGSDAHTLQLSPGKVRAIADAGLIVINGAGLEAGFEQALEENASVDPLDLSQAIKLGAGQNEDRVDPHFWLDASLAAEAIRAIAAALQDRLPQQAAAIEERRDAYLSELAATDAELLTSLAALSDERRRLVTLHNAYGYFARRYGLEIVGFVVEGPGEEPSAEDIAALVDEIRRRGIPRIYTEDQFTARIVERIASETGIEIRRLVSLPSDEFPSYLAILRANADAIRQ